MVKKNKSDKRASHYKYIGSNISSCTKKATTFGRFPMLLL